MASAISDSVKQMTEGVKQMSAGGRQPKPPKGDKKNKKDSGAAASGPDELETPPAYFDHRIKLFEKLKAKYDAAVAQKPRDEIKVFLPDGKVEVGKAWETTPADVAKSISKSLFERIVISEVDGVLWDLERPLEKSCSLKLLDFEHPEGKKVFWHSSAHILGEAAERRFGCDLCIGPPVEDGFYYEMALPGGAVVQASDLEPLERVANKAIKEKQPFVRLELSKDDLLEMFKTNKYKQHIIKDKIADGSFTTVYRCGPLIDLCRGPHVPHTGRIKCLKVMKNSASYFLGDKNNDSLQRIYGVSFPDKKQLEEHLKFLKQAAERDHRKIGREQELFFFHELSPGSCFFLPHGMIIYNTLQSFLREEYWKRGYQEVNTPNIYNAQLFMRSGHWDHYKDNMFTFDVEKDPWGLKPMNCPGHCLMFKHRERSYRELPMRLADFGVLHRNEASGALTGLTRVRRFQQDDAHIFCTQDQVESEMAGMFDFLSHVYGKFGFSFKLKLSTRPEKYLGAISDWNIAEAKLSAALDEFTKQGGGMWELNPGDGAFYGPKIDITICDALRREFQCATIQLDFQNPQRFELEYMTNEPKPDASDAGKPKDAAASAPASSKKPEAAHESPKPAPAPADGNSSGNNDNNSGDGKASSGAAKSKSPAAPFVPRPPPAGYARPVMIHRAVYGSFERFVAILTEHFAGKWPFWLSPRQVLVVPVMVAANEYAGHVRDVLRAEGMHADADVGGNTLQKKIRSGQLAGYNFIFVVGANERDSRTVNIRNRDDPSTQKLGELVPLDEAVSKLRRLKNERRLENRMT